jgi:uncharacterized protein affecting Mg2+/Co2+ transport
MPAVTWTGETDVTRGEIDIDIRSSSTTTTGPLEVQVSSTYNTEQTDSPVRKHCFQYTIRITKNSPTETVQLLGRKFQNSDGRRFHEGCGAGGGRL